MTVKNDCNHSSQFLLLCSTERKKIVLEQHEGEQPFLAELSP